MHIPLLWVCVGLQQNMLQTVTVCEALFVVEGILVLYFLRAVYVLLSAFTVFLALSGTDTNSAYQKFLLKRW